MDSSKQDPSTRELIAEGEALRAGKPASARDLRTRKLVREAEQLIGRPPSAPAVSTTLILVLILAVAGVAALLAYLYL